MAKKKRFIVALPLATASWPHLEKPDAYKAGDEAKYKIDLIFDADTDFSTLEAKILEAIHDEWGAKVKPAAVRSFLKDGDELNAVRENNGKDAVEAWAGRKVIKASGKFRPDVVDAKKNKIDPAMVRGGDRVCALLELVPCTPSGIRAVGQRLLAVQLIEKNNTGGGGWGNAFDEAEGYTAEDSDDTGTQSDDSNEDF